jgi:HEPN superfamily Swt1-like protein
LTDASLDKWFFRAIMFEAASEKLRSAGIRVGADQTDVEARLLEEVLAPFSVQLRSEAMRMTRVYALIYCFENSVRELIRDRLQEKHGTDWWTSTAVPKKIRDQADSRRDKANGNVWLEGERSDPLQFVDFGGLSDIIIQNWDVFTDLIPTQHWLKQRMDELEQARNYIAHNRLLADTEFRRIESYVGDWLRQVGV